MSKTGQVLNTVKNPRRFMTTIYVVSLAVIALLSIVTHLVLQSVIEYQSQTGVLVNKSGQQRMLSQRASMFAIEYLKTGDEEARLLSLSAIETMEENHRFLVGEHLEAVKNGKSSPLSKELQALYFEAPVNINEQITLFKRYIFEALQNPDTSDNTVDEKKFLNMAKKPFLDGLNAVVTQYEQQSVSDVDELSFAQDVVLLIVILTILAEAVFVFRPMVKRISDFAKRLQHEANYDYLSNLYNRRAFFMITEKLLLAARRNKQLCSVILLDIDKFKYLNDTHGHDVGDIVIRELGLLFPKQLRDSDIIARFGGEEFIIFLPDTSLENAVFVANSLRAAIENESFLANDKNIKVTVSAGVAKCDYDQSLDVSIKKADILLYQAKHDGRNKVCSEA